MTDPWLELRHAEFPVAQRWAYFDHAAVAPLPSRSGAILRRWADEQVQSGVVHWPDWERRLVAHRARIAELVHAEPDEIALVNSTTQGINIVAEGFPWRSGDNVVAPEEEYPSNLYPWMNLVDRGVELRLIPTRGARVELDDLAAAIDSRTRLLSISHVQFGSGFRSDLDSLAALCQSRGVAFFVDAIQGLGPFEIDLGHTPIDFLAADGHKWLLGPEGAGFLFIRRSWIDRLRPTGVGWHSVTTSYNNPKPEFSLKPSAERWEGGSFAMPGHQAFASSLELILEIGPTSVSARILERAERVRDLARSCGWHIHGSDRPEDLSGIVALEKEGVSPDSVARVGRSRGVVVASRRGRLRVSPHVYNDEDDLERLGELLRNP